MRIRLDELNGLNGFVAEGVDEQDRSGLAVGGAGDINGDGFADVIIGAYAADPNGKSAAGEAYVIFGGASLFSARLQLANLNGLNGFVLNGAASGDRTGYFVSSAGDLNADGLDDLTIGAYTASPYGEHFAGTGYVVFGDRDDFPETLELASLNGQDGLQLHGNAADDLFGGVIGSAGDVNGDGVDDIVIGARYEDRPGAANSGAAYVLYGGSEPFPANISASDISGNRGFAILGATAEDRLGISVAGVGDVNGDGIGDVVVGAYQIDPFERSDAGGAYIVFGQAGTRSTLDLAATSPGQAVTLAASAAFDWGGWSVAGAGDVNGDGIEDLLVGSFRADKQGIIDAGAVHVVFGRAGGWPETLDLGALDGTDGFTIRGENRLDKLGLSVSGAGDFNADGLDDIIIGAYAADPAGRAEAGRSYIVFGRSDGVASVDLSTLGENEGVIFDGLNVKDFSGFSVAGAGDVNGDGAADAIIGGRLADPNGTDSGESYIVFGVAGAGHPASVTNARDNAQYLSLAAARAAAEFGDSLILEAEYKLVGEIIRVAAGDVLTIESPFVASGDPRVEMEIDSRVTSLGAGRVVLSGPGTVAFDGATTGARIDLTGASPHAGAAAGDLYVRVNTFDLSRHADRFIAASAGVVVHGMLGDDALIGGAGTDVITGDGGNDNLVGGANADRLYGGSGNDQLFGGTGDDLLVGSTGNDSLDGGSGDDRLKGGPGDDVLDGGADADFLAGGAGQDTISGGAGVDILIGDGGNDVIDGGANADRLYGGSGNDQLFGGTGNDILIGSAGNDSLNGGGGDDFIRGDTGGDQINGGSGVDTADYSNALSAIFIDLRKTTPQNTKQGTDTLTGIENLIGSEHGDNFIGQQFNNRFDGGGGNDRFRGASGNDILNGEAGNDFMVGDAGNDIIDGGIDNDRLHGGSGNDHLFGGDGADILAGGPGVDRLDGGAGADRLFADSTADTFVFNDLAGAGDRVFGFDSGLHNLEIDASGFGGVAGEFQFVSGEMPISTTNSQTFLYDIDDGKLFFDADGIDASPLIHVLTLYNAPTLAAADIILV